MEYFDEAAFDRQVAEDLGYASDFYDEQCTEECYRA